MDSQIKKLSKLMASKQISCVELTQKYIDAIENENNKICNNSNSVWRFRFLQ